MYLSGIHELRDLYKVQIKDQTAVLNLLIGEDKTKSFYHGTTEPWRHVDITPAVRMYIVTHKSDSFAIFLMTMH